MKGNSEMAGSGGRCPGFRSNIRTAPEIPTLVVNVDGRNFFGSKGNFLEPSDFYDAALAGDDLIEGSTVPEFHGNHLITYAGFS